MLQHISPPLSIKLCGPESTVFACTYRFDYCYLNKDFAFYGNMFSHSVHRCQVKFFFFFHTGLYNEFKVCDTLSFV